MKKKKSTYIPEETANVVGNIAIVFISLLLLCLGLVMLLTDAVKMIYFCYAAGGCLLVWGIWLISRYFLRHEFQETTNYGFSVGTMVVILGAVDLIRAQEIAESIPNYLGILVLLEGVVMLQNAVQLKNLRGKLWVISLLFSLVSVAASIVILLDVQHIISNQVEVLYIILICVGAFALLSLCLVGSRTRKYHKEFHREQERQMQESEEWFQGVAAAKQETKTLEEVTEQEETAEEKKEEIEESDSQEG